MVELMKPAKGRVGRAIHPKTGESKTVHICKEHGAERFTVQTRSGDSWLLNGSEISNVRMPIL